MDVNLSRGSLAGMWYVGKRNWEEGKRRAQILGSDRLGRRDGKTTVEHLTEWFEDDMVESYIGSCIWSPENEHGGSEKGVLNVTNLSDEDMTQERWATGETLSRSWERLSSPIGGGNGDHYHVSSEPTSAGLLNRGPSVRVSGPAQALAFRGTRDSCELVHRIP